MKILMLISSLGVGGAETHVCSLAEGLIAQGHKVYIASCGGELVERVLRIGARHIRVPLDSRSPLSVCLSYKRLCRVVEQEDFDIIHAHSRISGYLCSKLSKKYGICFVSTVHAKFSLGILKRRMSRWGYRSAAVSADLAEYLMKNYNVAPKNIEIIPNGIDVKKFSPGGERRGRSVCFMSRLDADSSEAAVSLCKIARQLYFECGIEKICIIGGGSEYKRISALADKVNADIGARVITLTGSLEDPAEYLRGSLVFVGVARCALEAMSCGTPCVIAGNEGMLGALTRENIAYGERCNFCARGQKNVSPGALKSEISKILSLRDGEYRELCGFLREYVLKTHSQKRMAQQTEAFYIRAKNSFTLGGGACICGYYGYKNLGDETLLECAILRAKKRFGERGVSVLSKRPMEEQYRHGVRCVPRKNIFAVIREIYRSHHLIFGGGTLFQDKTSMRSFLYYASLGVVAHFFGARIEFWGSGFVPLRHALCKKLLRKILGFSDYIELRDKRSYELVLSMGAPRSKCHLARDMAFDISPGKRGRGDGEKYVFVSVCGRNPRRTHRKIFVRAVELLLRGKKIVVVGMYPREDREEGMKLAERLGCRYVEPQDARQLIVLLRQAEICCSERLHLLIFSAIAGVRFEGFGHDAKILSFCEEYGGRYCGYDCS